MLREGGLLPDFSHVPGKKKNIVVYSSESIYISIYFQVYAEIYIFKYPRQPVLPVKAQSTG